MIITDDTTRRFISRSRLPKVPRSADRGLRGAIEDLPPLELKAKDAQALVVGSGLVVAAEKVPVQVREDVVNCTLFAQLVATAEVGDPTKVNEWYGAYFRALTNLGWAQSDQQFQKYRFDTSGAVAHQAVLPVVTALLGPQAAALAVLKAAFDGLKEMSENAPWITLFERYSRVEQSAHFQVATAEVGEGGLVQVALVAFDLQAHSELIQVLFFKFNKAKTLLNYSAGRATIYEAALASQREALAQRLAAYRKAYVGQVRLPPLPAP
ncbi:hypothetical protein HLB44_02160 [Aquincola sp. S2]|uniref:Uncharacterized protein n=1 Tax=Pseudaquabacterium terrae TaxID=2732868 RepID=A0ABX2EAL9_9BURK|nr:hypothetical protein [Aquabacterium terrae]NRF65782.1 hypothetical protein [Aquabacterium terrae]